MRMRLIVPLMLAASVSFATQVRIAGEDANLLDEAGVRALGLSPKAEAYYMSALEKTDRIDYMGALDDLAMAAATDTGNIELQFSTVKFSRAFAEVTYGEDSVKLYDNAEQALRRLLANPSLGPEERTRVARESERVRMGKDGLRSRDDARLETGFKVVMMVHDERVDRSNLTRIKPASLNALETREEETDDKLKPEDIWAERAAPGASFFDAAKALAQGTGSVTTDALGQAALGADPFAAGAGGGADPFAAPAGGGADPFGASDPFGNSNAAPPPAADPFAQPAQPQAPPATGNPSWDPDGDGY